MHMRGCHLFCASMHQRVPYGKTQDLLKLWTTIKSVSKSAHAQSLNMSHRKTHLNVPHAGKNLNALVYIGIAIYIVTELSRRKGSVTYGLGADTSLPPCLATGIWNLAPKATSGPKSRGASFGTTLWHSVQRYCCFSILLAHAQLS